MTEREKCDRCKASLVDSNDTDQKTCHIIYAPSSSHHGRVYCPLCYEMDGIYVEAQHITTIQKQYDRSTKENK